MKKPHQYEKPIQLKCEACNGNGEVRNSIFMDDRYDDMMECPHCEGKGL